jgi:hypothetical protein
LLEQEFFSIANWKECVENQTLNVMHWEVSDNLISSTQSVKYMGQIEKWLLNKWYEDLAIRYWVNS